MMYSRITILAFLAYVVVASAFHVQPIRSISRAGRLFSEPENSTPKPPTPSKSTELAPVNDETIASAAGVTGGVFGFVLGGPIFALLFGTATVYVSKKDNEVAEGVRGIGKAVVETYNYFTKLNNKFDFTGKATTSITKAIDEAAVDSEVVGSVKEALNKAKDLNKEYDIVGKTTNAVAATTTLTEAAYEKVEELNEKYDFVDTAKKFSSTAVEKVKEATKEG